MNSSPDHLLVERISARYTVQDSWLEDLIYELFD
jgi:hypothetical protein